METSPTELFCITPYRTKIDTSEIDASVITDIGYKSVLDLALEFLPD